MKKIFLSLSIVIFSINLSFAQDVTKIPSKENTKNELSSNDILLQQILKKHKQNKALKKIRHALEEAKKQKTTK